MPKLSVIIPVFNTEQYLKACIESVISQSFTDFELICVDNHSTDGSLEIMKEFAAKDSRVRLYSTEKHGRPPESRQCGLQYAIGEFLTYVDSDDSIKPGMYEHMIDEQQKNGADIVVCNFDMVYHEKTVPAYSDMQDEVIDVKSAGYEYYFNKYFGMQRPNNYLWSRIIRRSIPSVHQITFQPVDISEDTIFTMFCTAFANRVVHVSKSYYNYFQRDDSAMRVTIRRKNIAESYVFAFDCVEEYVNTHRLNEAFSRIMPVYAATRVRSIIFYVKLVGNDDNTANKSLVSAIKDSSMPKYLERAVKEKLIKDSELLETTKQVLKMLEGEL